MTKQIKICIASGKGGVGKSMLSANLAALFAKNFKTTAVDCDADAPNLAIWSGLDVENEKPIETKNIGFVKKAVINQSKCKKCGLCQKKCKFNAVIFNNNKYEILNYKCEGCGLCQIVCPNNSIEFNEKSSCLLQVYKTPFSFDVIQGEINPGEAESGNIVMELKDYADENYSRSEIVVYDSAAGIGCPVIASINKSNYVVVVVEPSKSSIYDAERLIKVLDQFEKNYLVVINKADINYNLTELIKEKYQDKILGCISYEPKIVELLNKKELIVTSSLNKVNFEIEKIYKKLIKKIGF